MGHIFGIFLLAFSLKRARELRVNETKGGTKNASRM